MRSSEADKNILLICPNWVGDTMLITPALASLRRRYPNSHIAALVSPWVGPLLAQNPNLNELIIYDPKGRHRSWAARLRLANELHRLGFDMAILFPNSFHAALLAYLAHIPKRVGYNTDGRGLLLTQRIPQNKGDRLKHQVEYYLDIIRALGIEIHAQGLYLRLSAADNHYAKQLLTSSGVDALHPLVAIHPGAVKPQKRWSAERFAQVGRSLITQYRAGIILLGSPNEQGLLQGISRLIDSPQALIPKAASLTQTAALIAHCQLFIGNDSGLMHVAAALGAPIVALFGPGTPAATAPWMDRNLYRLVLAEFSCRPCRQRFFTECSPSPQGKPPCLEAIPVEQVLAAVAELWEQLPQQRRVKKA